MKTYAFILLLAAMMIACRDRSAKSTYSTTQEISVNFGDECQMINKVSRINIRFIYRNPINGYEVSIDWQPFDPKSETGTAKIAFNNPITGKSFEYVNQEKYSNAAIYHIVFSDGFEGHHRDTTYYIDYDFKFERGLKPIHHEAPFQFLDIDFDGEDDLLINNWDLSRGGNTYNVYDIVESQEKLTLNLKRDMPFDGIQDSSLINSHNKTITIGLHGSSADYCAVVFSKQAYRQGVFEFPDSLQHTTGGMIVEDYNRQLSSEFRIDTVYQHLNGRDYIFTQPKR